MFLSGKDLYEYLKNNSNFISGYQLPTNQDITRTSQVQPASFDLTIGSIYIPGTGGLRNGGIGHPLTELELKPGHTAILETRETLNLPREIAAFGFPPATISLGGLLMTNPGHVDPGFSGKLRFTVINMGKEVIELSSTTRIVTLLFFKLQNPSDKCWSDLFTNADDHRLSKADLGKLSSDFLDVQQRSRSEARKASVNLQTTMLLLPIVLAALALMAPIFSPTSKTDDKIQNLSDRVTRLEAAAEPRITQSKLETFEKRLAALEKQQPTVAASPQGKNDNK